MANKKKMSTQQVANKQEEARQRILVKEILYPHLLKNTKTIADAKMLCTMANLYVQQSFSKKIVEEQTRLSKEKLSILKLEDLDVQTKSAKDFIKLFAIFQNESIATTTSLIGGMVKAIESFEKEEETKRHLDSLKATFL